MLAQKITFDLMQNKLDDIRVVHGDSCREILFEGSDLDGVLSYEDYTYEFDLMKSDGTFVIQTLSAGILIPSEQMEVITGTHYYSVKIKDADNELVYSGQGAFIVDDNVITEDAIESVAEVNSLVFPDDFLTINDHFAEIDDTTTSTTNTWSSDKINDVIEEAIESIPDPVINYSYDEHATNRIWVDGRTIYSRTYLLQNIPNVSDWTSFASPGNIRLIDTEVSAIFYNGQCSNSLYYFSVSYNPPNSPGNLCYYHSVASGFNNVYVTIYYVKEA